MIRDLHEDHIYESSANHPLETEDGCDWLPAELQPFVPTGIWMVSTGEEIAISGMTDEHLRNAIAWAHRNGFGESAKVEELKLELEKR